MKKISTIFIVLFGFVVQSAQADLLGLANGRSANLDNMADMSVEGGVTIGGDFRTFGARFNYKVSPDMMVFGGLGQTTIDSFGDDASGISFGGGVVYQLRNMNLLENTSTAIKGAYHNAPLDLNGVDFTYSEITIEALISGDQLSTTDFGWYANAGLHIVKSEFDFGGFGSGSDSETELGFGGGIIGQMSVGEWYAGVDFIDGALLVGGFRYNL